VFAPVVASDLRAGARRRTFSRNCQEVLATQDRARMFDAHQVAGTAEPRGAKGNRFRFPFGER